MVRWAFRSLAALGAALALAGCGGSSASKSTTAQPASAPTTTVAAPSTTPAPATTPAKPASSPGALQAEASSAATGDIPDNQVFLVYRNGAAGWSMKYPEGWAQSGSGQQVAFRDKNNIVRVVIVAGAAPTVASVRHGLARRGGVDVQGTPQPVALPSGRAVKVVYSTESAPNAVTGKRVALAVDRYYVAGHGKVAVVDLGTPQGVDNVDAYRLMIQSFRWR